MTIRFEDLELKTRLPDVPASLPVYTLAAPPAEERRAAIGRLAERLKLGTLRSVELDHGRVYASERGDVTHFHASGAVWARDATASAGAENELRKWPGLRTDGPVGQRASLPDDAAKRLIGQARELLEPLGLLGKEVAGASVVLDQVAQLDAKGNEIAAGAGAATVRFDYAIGGVPVRGAGAKTLLYAEPGDATPRVAGVFHAWRLPGEASAVKLGTLADALGAGLLSDPELDRHFAAGHKIRIDRIELVYMALPAFLRQEHLFPMFQLEGFVAEGKLGIGFHWGRFHHVARPRAYAATGRYAPYLAANPDGVKPTDLRRTVQ